MKLAAGQNHELAQLYLGILYFSLNNFKKAYYYLDLSAKQNNHDAQFCLGTLYTIGEYVPRDIEKAIYYYKEASSFNNNYAKNNLAIIYKNGIGIDKNIWYSIELLKESIHQKNDEVSMYNLSHIYIYEETGENNFDEAIKLLIKSSKKFDQSIYLLSILLIKKYKKVTFEQIETEIKKFESNNESEIIAIVYNVYNFIVETNMEQPDNFRYIYQLYKNIDFMYSVLYLPEETVDLMNKKTEINEEELDTRCNINNDFYEGFGI